MAEEIGGFLRVPRPGEFVFDGPDFVWEVSRDKTDRGEPVVVLKLSKTEDDLDFVRLAFRPERAGALAAALSDAKNAASRQGSDVGK